MKTSPVTDSIAKVDHEIAVGEDLQFQRSWWKFERVAWSVFALLIVMDLLGAFGRGPLAKAQATAADGSMLVKYERIERTSTPSILRVELAPSAIHNQTVHLYISDSMQTQMGAQRVIPSPASSVIGNGGLEYTFPVTTPPAMVEFAMEPDGPGLRHVTLQIPGAAPLRLAIFVMP